MRWRRPTKHGPLRIQQDATLAAMRSHCLFVPVDQPTLRRRHGASRACPNLRNASCSHSVCAPELSPQFCSKFLLLQAMANSLIRQLGGTWLSITFASSSCISAPTCCTWHCSRRRSHGMLYYSNRLSTIISSSFRFF